MYLGALGVSVGDLPMGGKNLRLYTYDPPGTPYGPGSPTGGLYAYNTGHYDVSLPGGPCAQSDPQGFQNWQSMSSYAGARGEMLVLVSRDDLPALCSARPAAAAPAPAPAPPVPPPSSDLTTTIKLPVRAPMPAPPIVITTPGGGGPVYIPAPAPPISGPAPSDGGLPLPWIVGGATVLLLLARR
jgi:hypothetical protein